MGSRATPPLRDYGTRIYIHMYMYAHIICIHYMYTCTCIHPEQCTCSVYFHVGAYVSDPIVTEVKILERIDLLHTYMH